MEYEIQTSENKSAIWIHASDGSTVGRFGTMGIDLHNTVTEQLNGASQCRLCTHRQVNASDWDLFKEKSLEFFGVKVSDDSFDKKLFKEK